MLEVILILLVLLVWLGWVQPWIPRCVISKKNISTRQSQKASDLHCRVEMKGTDDQGGKTAAFEVKIRGLISASSQKCVDVQVLIADVQDERGEPRPILSTVKQLQMEDSPAFCFHSRVGNLPSRETILSDWTPIAQIRADLLRFPRKGKRKLKFITSIICSADSQELACAVATIDYQNDQVGYIDAKENQQRSEMLTVRLAGALCRSAGKVDDSAVKVVTDWIGTGIGASASKDGEAEKRSELEQSLEDALGTFEAHNQPNFDAVCREMAEAATIIERYEAMELCLRVAKAAGSIKQKQIVVLSRLANLLRLDPDKFQAMVQKILPLDIYENKDVEFILGITADMTADDARRRLNSEYRKWNARVTHPDPATRAQAGQMLALIAEVRAGYAQASCVG